MNEDRTARHAVSANPPPAPTLSSSGGKGENVHA